MTDHGFYDGLAMEMRGQLNRLASFTKNRASSGYCHEEILRATLRSMLSPRFGLRSGYSFASEGNVSAQGDILIVDEMDPVPYLFHKGDLVVVQPRALVCVIEVKSTLNKQTFADAIENLASFRPVAEGAMPARPPATYVFAFRSARLLAETLDGWYKDVRVPDAWGNYPLAVLSLQRGSIRLKGAEHTQFGHYQIEGDDGEGPYAIKSLAMFLSSIWTQVEMHAKIESNAYAQAPLDGLRWSTHCFRYGIGRVPMRQMR